MIASGANSIRAISARTGCPVDRSENGPHERRSVAAPIPSGARTRSRRAQHRLDLRVRAWVEAVCANEGSAHRERPRTRRSSAAPGLPLPRPGGHAATRGMPMAPGKRVAIAATRRDGVRCPNSIGAISSQIGLPTARGTIGRTPGRSAAASCLPPPRQLPKLDRGTPSGANTRPRRIGPTFGEATASSGTCRRRRRLRRGAVTVRSRTGGGPRRDARYSAGAP